MVLASPAKNVSVSSARSRCWANHPTIAANEGSAAAAVGAARDLARLHQLEPRVVRPLQERDARSARILDGAFEQRGAQPREATDVGLEVGRVEPEVLEAVVRHRVALAHLLVRARAG